MRRFLSGSVIVRKTHAKKAGEGPTSLTRIMNQYSDYRSFFYSPPVKNFLRLEIAYKLKIASNPPRFKAQVLGLHPYTQPPRSTDQRLFQQLILT